jgi:hypothetical protein
MVRLKTEMGLAGQKPGIKEVDKGIWLVSFMITISDISTWKKNVTDPRQPVRPEDRSLCTAPASAPKSHRLMRREFVPG